MTVRAVRRTQIERRATTRAALLDATARCLVERGYAGTSTNDIIRVAGVSRGALLHHFASKAELLGEAVEHVFDRCEREFREAFAQLPVEERTLERAVDELWRIFRGPSYDAALELLVAARTDDELRVVLQGVMERFGRNVLADFGVLFPASAGSSRRSALVSFAFATLQGAAIAQDIGLDEEADDVVDVLRALARLGDLPGSLSPDDVVDIAHAQKGPAARRPKGAKSGDTASFDLSATSSPSSRRRDLSADPQTTSKGEQANEHRP